MAGSAIIKAATNFHTDVTTDRLPDQISDTRTMKITNGTIRLIKPIRKFTIILIWPMMTAISRVCFCIYKRATPITTARNMICRVLPVAKGSTTVAGKMFRIISNTALICDT